MNARNTALLMTAASVLTMSAVTASASGLASIAGKESFQLAAASAKSGITNNLDQIRLDWNSFHTDNGFLTKYVKKNLSTADKKAFSDAIKQFHRNSMLAYKTKIQELKNRYGTGNPDLQAIKRELSNLIDSRMATLKDSVSKYIDPGKKAAFEKFLSDRAAKMKANAAIRIGNTQAKIRKK